MTKFISTSKFDTTIGPVRLTGVLFLADPRSDSFATGDAGILGFESLPGHILRRLRRVLGGLG
jgi:hypothetical protein